MNRNTRNHEKLQTKPVTCYTTIFVDRDHTVFCPYQNIPNNLTVNQKLLSNISLHEPIQCLLALYLYFIIILIHNFKAV